MFPLIRFILIRTLFEAFIAFVCEFVYMCIRSLGYGPIRYLFFQTRGATQHTNGGCILKVETHSRPNSSWLLCCCALNTCLVIPPPRATFTAKICRTCLRLDFQTNMHTTIPIFLSIDNNSINMYRIFWKNFKVKWKSFVIFNILIS